jgi:hypothetical protein
MVMTDSGSTGAAALHFDDLDLSQIDAFDIEIVDTSRTMDAETAASCAVFFCSCLCGPCRGCSCNDRKLASGE